MEQQWLLSKIYINYFNLAFTVYLSELFKLLNHPMKKWSMRDTDLLRILLLVERSRSG